MGHHRTHVFRFPRILLIAGAAVLAGVGFGADIGLAQSENQQINPTVDQKLPVPNFWDPRNTATKPNLEITELRFLASDDFPPFSFRDAKGNLTGFNIDLSRALCQELELSCSLRVKDFTDLEKALIDDEGDAIIAGIAITEASRERLLFTDPYLRIPGRFVVRADFEGDPRPESLNGRTISVIKGTAHEAYLKRFFVDSEIATFETADDARDALRDGAVDAHFSDSLSLGFWLYSEDAADCCVFKGGAWDNRDFFGPGHSIALPLEDAELAQAINYAFRRLYEKGLYRELYFRYFPGGLY
ncbi:MAG: transporter substrate-binding domain-containing protein [Stappiaceae bacterium]